MSEEKTLLRRVIEELKTDPEGAVELLSSMASVVRPWERVSDHKSGSVSYFRRLTVMGQEVASFQNNAPTWILEIQGEKFLGEKVFNRKGAQEACMKLLDAELEKRDFILMESQNESE